MKSISNWLAVVFGLGFVVVGSLQADESSQLLAKQVREIFSVKCVECHGADIERPKGKFGYVLDLARVAANPKMIVPGNPAKSELYLMVFNNEMPNAKAVTSLPLTDDEKETVKHWIEAGAPAIAAAAPVEPPLTLGRRIIRDLGQFHPLTVHFPIALLIVALPAELLWKRSRNPAWKSIVRFCVALGAASAVVAAILGWCIAAFASYTNTAAQVLEWHRWVGTVTGVWAVLAVVLSELAGRPGASGRMETLFRCVLGSGVVLVMIAGYLGASLIYGLNHFVW